MAGKKSMTELREEQFLLERQIENLEKELSALKEKDAGLKEFVLD